MQLSYWVARCLKDSPCYSIRRKTKKEVEALLASGEYTVSDFDKPKKVVIEYSDGFDLMQACLSGEDRGGWEE